MSGAHPIQFAEKNFAEKDIYSAIMKTRIQMDAGLNPSAFTKEKKKMVCTAKDSALQSVVLTKPLENTDLTLMVVKFNLFAFQMLRSKITMKTSTDH